MDGVDLMPTMLASWGLTSADILCKQKYARRCAHLTKYCSLCLPPYSEGQDLASGNLTAPTLFALRRRPELRKMIENQFSAEGEGEGKEDLPAAIKLVTDFGIEVGMKSARHV